MIYSSANRLPQSSSWNEPCAHSSSTLVESLARRSPTTTRPRLRLRHHSRVRPSRPLVCCLRPTRSQRTLWAHPPASPHLRLPHHLVVRDAHALLIDFFANCSAKVSASIDWFAIPDSMCRVWSTLLAHRLSTSTLTTRSHHVISCRVLHSCSPFALRSSAFSTRERVISGVA